jgi:ribosomal protein L12E/L44/L45/RPP1/RPP2
MRRVFKKTYLVFLAYKESLFHDKTVKNPTEAALDSKLLVMSASLGAQRARKTHADLRQFDVGEFLRKVVRSMRAGAAGGAGRAERRNVEEEQEQEHPELDWARLGRCAYKHIATAPNLTFM